MHTSISSDFVALHSQHTLQQADLLAVYNLAKDEGIGEYLDSYSFEDFLGLTVYLFVTTQSQNRREQLSQLLSKFGSAVVLPLLKILGKKEVFAEQSIPFLAQQSLDHMAPYPLMIGLNQVLDLKVQEPFQMVALQTATQLLSCDPSIQWVLSQLLSETNRQLVAEFSVFQLSDQVSVQHHDIATLDRKAVHCV